MSPLGYQCLTKWYLSNNSFYKKVNYFDAIEIRAMSSKSIILSKLVNELGLFSFFFFFNGKWGLLSTRIMPIPLFLAKIG